MIPNLGHPLPVGAVALAQDAYLACVCEVGIVPDDHPFKCYRGLPGYRVRWFKLDEDRGGILHELEPLLESGTRGWVPQSQCDATIRGQNH